MALKDIWTNKTDGVDDILADDINAIANEVISNTENKADKADVHTKKEVDEQFERIGQVVSNASYEASTALTKVENKAEQSYVDSAINELNEKANMAINDINLNTSQIDSLWRDKADKSDVYTKQETDTAIEQLNSSLDWVLIGEEEVTEADVVDAGENGVTAVTIDLGAPIEQWYNETLIRVFIPKSSDLNPTITSGKLKIHMGDTETNSVTGYSACIIVGSQKNNVLVDARYKQEYTITSNWLNKQTLTHSYIAYRGYGASSGYVVNPFQAYNSVESKSVNSASKRRFLSLLSFYGKAVNGVEEKTMFKYPAGTKISLYGRM